MTHLLALVLLAQSGQVRATDLNVGGAADVRGYRRGVDALSYDPAAGAFADGFALQYRQRFADAQRSFYGVQALVPGPLSLGAGYEWFPGASSRVERGTLNMALRYGRVALGASYQRYRVLRGDGDGGGVWNLGLFAEATRWLSLSLGVDALNSPTVLDGRQRFAYRVGGAVRPIAGAPWLTVGGETRLDSGSYDWGSTRAVLELSHRSVRGFAAYDFNQEQAWFGLSLALGPVEARSSVGTQTADGANDDPIGALAVTLRARPTQPQLIRPTRTVEVVLSGNLRREGALFRGGQEVSPVSYELHELARDPTVATVVISVGALSVGTADLESVRGGINALKAAGKRVEAEIGYIDDRGYMIAAAADHIRVDPSAILRVDGFSVTRRYYADFLAKIGVRVTAVAIGDYKSAPESYTRNGPTPEADEVTGELLDYFYDELIAALVDGRGKTEEEARALVDRGIFTAQDAVEAGLADELTYPADPTVVPEPRSRGVALESARLPGEEWSVRDAVEVIPVVGTISMNGSSPLPGSAGATAPAVVRRLEAAMRDDSVPAVVLFINSPGGEVGASDLIWRAVKRLASRKPVITCMGNVAASGGYWIASATDTIIAQPGTITGSIGIFQLKPDIEKLYEMLGINAVVDKRGALADLNSETRSATEDELKQARAVMGKEYDRFIGKVSAARGLAPERVREIAGGRVYTGQRAKELGLIDEFGGLARAVELAAQRAGLDHDDYRVSIPEGAPNLFRGVSAFGELSAQSDLVSFAHKTLERIRALEGVSLALLPIEYEVKW
ncbi:MAG: signal peptide peptidase SppA [Myxococcota bacterium]